MFAIPLRTGHPQCYKRLMQKPLTPKQQREYERLDSDRKRAEGALHEAEIVSGKGSVEYAVAERQKAEIVARMRKFNPPASPRWK